MAGWVWILLGMFVLYLIFSSGKASNVPDAKDETPKGSGGGHSSRGSSARYTGTGGYDSGGHMPDGFSGGNQGGQGNGPQSSGGGFSGGNQGGEGTGGGGSAGGGGGNC